MNEIEMRVMKKHTEKLSLKLIETVMALFKIIQNRIHSLVT